ncbi:MAG TPA: NAD-dependent epimerase/dehydratase family protein [Negativicutes bacterium]|nr:NAD-dependent epimerase/dehydratase family protein [Negativicutes bacterium]
MKILVTGGAGFIGSHIVDQLILAGHDVVVLDDLSSGSLQNVNPKATFINLNILDRSLGDVFERERFTAVIHLAAQTIVASSLERPDVDAQVNVLGTLQVLEGCRRTGVERIVFASSAAVYGDVSILPVPEEAPKQPTSFYGLSKLTAERYIQMYHELYGLHYMILRFANVYGERQGDNGEGGVVSIFARKMHRQEPMTVFGDGLQTRDFVYVGDIAAANVQAINSQESDRILNISTQTEITVNQLASLFAEVSGRETPITYQPAREGDILRSMLRNTAARSILNWMPSTSLREGLDRTYRAFTD